MFIAADGTNYATANSYVSLEYADAYHTVRCNDDWDGDERKLEAALIKATDYIEQKYGGSWIGTSDRYTGLGWPRYNTSYDTNVIPTRLKDAVCELALEALTGSLNPSIKQERMVKYEKTDVIETEYEGSVGPTLRPAVYGYLKSLLRGSPFNVPVVRA